MSNRRGTLGSIGEIPALKRVADRSKAGHEPDPTYSPPAPDCGTCQDTGWVGSDVALGEPGFGKALPCTECASPPRRIAPEGMTFEAFNLYGDPKLEAALKMAKAFAYGDWPIWVTFLGSNGSGKDHLSYAMIQARQDLGERVVATRSNQMLRLIFETMREGSAETEQDRVDYYARAGVLLLAELGKESQTDASRARTSEIFDERYAHQRPTIITSNWSLEAIGKVWPDVASRMGDGSLGAIVDLEGVQDHRKRG